MSDFHALMCDGKGGAPRAACNTVGSISGVCLIVGQSISDQVRAVVDCSGCRGAIAAIPSSRAPAVRAVDAPLPVEVLADARHDTVHKERGPSRPAVAVRAMDERPAPSAMSAIAATFAKEPTPVWRPAESRGGVVIRYDRRIVEGWILMHTHRAPDPAAPGRDLWFWRVVAVGKRKALASGDCPDAEDAMRAADAAVVTVLSLALTAASHTPSPTTAPGGPGLSERDVWLLRWASKIATRAVMFGSSERADAIAEEFAALVRRLRATAPAGPGERVTVAQACERRLNFDYTAPFDAAPSGSILVKVRRSAGRYTSNGRTWMPDPGDFALTCSIVPLDGAP